MPAQADNDPSPSQSQPGPVDSQARDIADAYFVEQAKLFEYLQDRHERFLNRYNDKFHKFKKRATPSSPPPTRTSQRQRQDHYHELSETIQKAKNSAESKPAESCVLATDIANTSPKPPSNQAISRPLSASVAKQNLRILLRCSTTWPLSALVFPRLWVGLRPKFSVGQSTLPARGPPKQRTAKLRSTLMPFL